MPRTAIASLALSCIGSLGAGAEPIRVAPEPCPIPADIAPLVSEDVGTLELNSWSDGLDDLLTFQDIPVAGGDFTLRIFADAATGEIYGLPEAPLECPEDGGASQ